MPQGKTVATPAVEKSNVPPISPQTNQDASSEFHQIVTEMIADATVPEDAPQYAAPQTPGLPAKSTPKAEDQPVNTDAPHRDAPLPLPETALAPGSAPTGKGHEQRSRPVQPTENTSAQLLSIPVDVTLPIPITPKWEPPVQSGAAPAPQPTTRPATSTPEEPMVLKLQPAPILEVKIHLNQPPTSMSLVPAAQPAVTQPSAVITVAGSEDNKVPPSSSVVNTLPSVTATSAIPAHVEPVTVAPVSIAPPIAPTVLTSPISTSPVPAPVSGPAPVPPPQPAPVDAQLTTPDVRESRTRQQNPDQGSSDRRDTDNNPAPEVSAQVIPRIVANPEVPTATPRQTRPDSAAAQPSVPQTPATLTGVAASPAPVPPTSPHVVTPETKPEPPAMSAAVPTEPLIDRAKAQQPIRSLALEFAPDGAGDIKVRLSERAGDVHISLHGSDSVLAGRMREGVSDLVGSLSKAGYDAEAWTPGQDRREQQQPPEQRKSYRSPSGGAEEKEFNNMLQQPFQEIS